MLYLIIIIIIIIIIISYPASPSLTMYHMFS